MWPIIQDKWGEFKTLKGPLDLLSDSELLSGSLSSQNGGLVTHFNLVQIYECVELYFSSTPTGIVIRHRDITCSRE
jgi:hypothetical protein